MSQYSFASVVNESPGLSEDMKALLLKHEFDFTQEEREAIIQTVTMYETKLYSAARKYLASREYEPQASEKM